MSHRSVQHPAVQHPSVQRVCPYLTALAAMGFLSGAIACNDGPSSPVRSRDFGAQLMADPRVSDSAFNDFSCATCHSTAPGADPQRILAGGSLHDVAARNRFLGGQTLRLLDAINFCYVYFMRGVALDKMDPRARALYEYLLSISPSAQADGGAAPVPMTIVRNIVDLPKGDAARGRALYTKACAECHGALQTGAGRISYSASPLPQVTSTYSFDFPGVPPARVVIEKVRHGQFFGVGGNMPFYSTEVLSDEALADIVAAMGL